jgi:hypothetical protein
MRHEVHPATTSSFRSEVEAIVNRTVKNNHPEDWDEDFITRELLREMRKQFGEVRLTGLREELRINWQTWKLAGDDEHRYGDVAMLVTIADRTGDLLSGAAFLEAKKRSNRRDRFGALKLDQLDRIYESAPHAMVLLYDYKPISEFVLNRGLDSGLWAALLGGHAAPDAGVQLTHAVVVPMSHVRAIQRKDVSLYRYSVPLSYQLLHRYLQGLDLEFHDEAISIAKGQRRDAAPKYLLHIYVGRDTDPPISGENAPPNDFYLPIEAEGRG